MHQLQYDKFGNATLKVKRVRAGLYEYVDYKGRLWVFEYREYYPYDDESEGKVSEWWCGTEDDPAADQYPTLWQAREATALFLAEGF